MKTHAKRFSSLAAASVAFILLMTCSAMALDAAKHGLYLCANIIIPSLFPFFVVSSLLGSLGLPIYLGKIFERPMSRIFGVSGRGVAAFILGITGGYPLGAATVAGMRQRREISRDEGERLLTFCNNSGPAFIIGAAGIGIFGSAKIGLALYAAHIFSALIVGLIFSNSRKPSTNNIPFSAVSFSKAFTEAVKNSVSATISICGFVVFFSVVSGILGSLGLFPFLSEKISLVSGLEPAASQALLQGILELGSGIGALSGLSATPSNLAVAAFILGWGSLSVHFQTISVISATDMSCTKHFLGRFLCGVISASIMLFLSCSLL